MQYPTQDVRVTRQGREEYLQKVVVDQTVEHSYHRWGYIQHLVRWYGHSPDFDSDEPIEHLPRSMVVQYHRRTLMVLLATIDIAQMG